ncbi:MAG: hypothetical protein OEW08_10520 [Gammaproteobacteria bacterium]|nr:hypothetical protein [Gammaproteobacteria bacterium]
MAGFTAWHNIESHPHLTVHDLQTALIEQTLRWGDDSTNTHFYRWRDEQFRWHYSVTPPHAPPHATPATAPTGPVAPLLADMWQALQTLPKLSILAQQRQTQIDTAVKTAFE